MQFSIAVELVGESPILQCMGDSQDAILSALNPRSRSALRSAVI